MSKKFLSRELIAAVAFRMIDENGTDSFSLSGLATKLGVQVSSLYNHIDNEYDLLLEAAKLAACKDDNAVLRKIDRKDCLLFIRY